MKIALGRDKTTPKIRQCPSCTKSFIGDCPVISCPLNITKRTTGLGGCFLFLKQPSIIEAAYQLGISSNTAERRYSAALQEALKLSALLNEMASIEEDEIHCEHCGKIGDDCSAYSCKRRKRFLEVVKANSLLGNKFLTISDNKIWKLLLGPNFKLAVEAKYASAAPPIYYVK